jgi:host factor-I protein
MADTEGRVGGSLVDRLMAEMRSNHRIVSVYLVNGFQLKGEIVDFDQEAILVKVKDAHQLVMRSGVASMYPIQGSSVNSEDWWSRLSNGAAPPGAV